MERSLETAASSDCGGWGHPLPFSDDGRPGSSRTWAPRSEGQLRPTNSRAAEASALARLARERGGKAEKQRVLSRRRTRPLPSIPRAPGPGRVLTLAEVQGAQVCRAHAGVPASLHDGRSLHFQSCSGARAQKAPLTSRSAPTNHRAPLLQDGSQSAKFRRMRKGESTAHATEVGGFSCRFKVRLKKRAKHTAFRLLSLRGGRTEEAEAGHFLL